MRQDEKHKLEQQTKNRHWAARFKAGCMSVTKSGLKISAIVSYIILALILWLFREQVFNLQEGDLFYVPLKGIVQLIFPVYAIGGLFLIIVAFGTPFGAKEIHNNLQRIGLCNHAGESPLLVTKYKDKNNPRISILEFETNGIPRKEWEDKRSKVESALNLHIAKVAEGENKRRILLHTISSVSALPDKLLWHEQYLNKENFVLVLGESLTGRKTVNLAQIPHILLGGSTGSGKSVLLKHLLMQCLQKDAVVCVADFKGGVDFSDAWHRKCRMCFDETDLLELLTGIVDELERRITIFRDNNCPNIDEYNKSTGGLLQRFIFACDEVAEVLDKNGVSREQKELVIKIEGKLSVIARQGRAFGIHLILATQRPDATILSGQIRNNIDCRVCGRADNVLSQIILDSTDAADQIPKDAQGRFITHEGVVFQGYLFDENRELEGAKS